MTKRNKLQRATKSLRARLSTDGTLGILLVYAVAGFLALFFFVAYLVHRYEELYRLKKWKLDQQELGQLGDFIGGLVNPFVGLLTVFLILITLLLQRRELRETNEALAKQNAVIARQSFEQTFFSWLSNYREHVASIVVKDRRSSSGRTPGRDGLFRAWEQYLSFDVVRAHCHLHLDSPESAEWHNKGILHADKHLAVVKFSIDSWSELYGEHEHHLDSMFRILYRLLKWIDEQPDSVLSNRQKFEYIAIARAQVSNVELLFLFFNGFSVHGKRFAYYINRYAFFDNLDRTHDQIVSIMSVSPKSPFTQEAFQSDIARAALSAS